ncbi:hypothetical protein ACFVU3_28495, partial [Streptomyces sp. NPDC058052]|uniref:hypothetical protein n=1 Tax=Streptomyces sp. NPDC058052 TaxID=3346316 RepID=UPI0036E5DCBD
MIHIVRGIMNFIRYRRPSAFLLLTVAIVFGAAAVAGLESGDEGSLVLLLGLREYVLLLGWLALTTLTGAVLLEVLTKALDMTVGDQAGREAQEGFVDVVTPFP